MDEPISSTPIKRNKPKRKNLFPPPDMDSHRKNAARAFNKLKKGERLSVGELIALFKVNYVGNKILEEVISTYGYDESLRLFKGFDWRKNKQQVKNQSTIICPSIELELLEYFKKEPNQLYEISTHPKERG